MDRSLEWVLRYQLFLFDFDGLLVNTEPVHFHAYRAMCAARGFLLDWDFSTFCSVAHGSATGLRERIYGQFPALHAMEPRWEVLYLEKKAAYERLLSEGAGVELMEGAAPLLKALEVAKVRRCVVTNSFRVQTEAIKARLPILQTIPHWITREDYLQPKPAPDGYLKAIKEFGRAGDRIIGFEDSLKGFKALLAAEAEGVLICSKDLAQVAVCQALNGRHFENLSAVS